MLSALKPAERGNGLVVRVLNPTDTSDNATLRWGAPIGDVIAVQLDEEPAGPHVAWSEALPGDVVRLAVPPHALRSVRVEAVER